MGNLASSDGNLATPGGNLATDANAPTDGSLTTARLGLLDIDGNLDSGQTLHEVIRTTVLALGRGAGAAAFRVDSQCPVASVSRALSLAGGSFDLIQKQAVLSPTDHVQGDAVLRGSNQPLSSAVPCSEIGLREGSCPRAFLCHFRSLPVPAASS